jgi:hypothetical protein
VKLGQFRALCIREWEQEDSRGDVTALHLTDESFAELERDAIMDGSAMTGLELFIRDAPGDGPMLSTLSNPVTRGPVTIDGGDTGDWFEVRRPVPYTLLEPADSIPV